MASQLRLLTSLEFQCMHIVLYDWDNVELGKDSMGILGNYGLERGYLLIFPRPIFLVCVQKIPTGIDGRIGCLGYWWAIISRLKKTVCVSLPFNLKRQRQGYSELFLYCFRFAKLEKAVHIKAGVD